MTLSGPYRERLPRTHDVEVQVKRWAIRKPFTRRNIMIDTGLAGLWVFCSLIDVLQLVFAYAPKHWLMLGIHLICVLGWCANVWIKLERKEVTETKQVTE